MGSLPRACRALLLLAFVGCASLTPGGAAVERVRDRATLKACVFLGDVSVRPSLGSEADDVTRIRNLAADVGGNAVWLDSTVVAPGGRLYAAAFVCRSAPSRAP